MRKNGKFNLGFMNRFGMVCSLGMATLWTGCSSTGTHVLERADDLSNRPDWVSTVKVSFIKEDKQYFVSFVTLEGNASISAAYNMSDEKALSEPFRSIVDDFLDQNQVDEDLQNSVGHRVISSLRKSRPGMPSLHIVNRYWERVGIRDSYGTEKTELRVFSLAELPISEFRQGKDAVLARLRERPELRQSLDQIAKAQRERSAPQESTE